MQQVSLTAFCTHQNKIVSDNTTKERHKLLVILQSYLKLFDVNILQHEGKTRFD